ncbi:MAG: SURF1 family protein [Gemmatimonadaceae bacterium]|nr:SURF1 family protein [Gemmatimonadaceae bacterium]
MTLSRSTLFALTVALACAGLFTRLGFWQLHRLAERQTWNAQLEQRYRAAPVGVAALAGDTALGHYHRVLAHGRFDFDRQVALATRSFQGSPGVHLLTPLRLDDGATVMVNRGWVYAPDAMTIDAAKWREREGDTVTVTGYAETWSGRETVPVADRQRIVRALDSSAVARLVGEPILTYYIAQTSDSARGTTRPVRLSEPVLSDGSHRSYAMQWFSFALIALVGGTLLVREEFVRRRASA